MTFMAITGRRISYLRMGEADIVPHRATSLPQLLAA